MNRLAIGLLHLTAGVLCAASFATAQQPLGRVFFEYRAPTLLVQARVNGSKPLWFAFDTGTSTCLIDIAVAQRLGIKPEPRPGRPGPGFARARALAVGRAEARDLELVLRDLSPLSQRLGVEVAGILGIAWMEQFVFEIDYRARRVTLWPRTVELTPRADQLPVPLEVRSPPGFTGATLFTTMTLEGEHRCPAEIDTGADAGVLGRAMAARLGVTIKPIASAEEGGLPTHTVGRVELGGRTFAAVPFVVDPRRAAANPSGQCVVGNELLKSFVVTIDIPRRRAFFRSLP